MRSSPLPPPRESQVQADILAALGSRADVRLFRASTGVARTPDGRTLRFGNVGQADLSGWIRPEGWRLEVEVKRPTAPGRSGGRLSPEQRRWLERAAADGCCAFVATSAAEALQQLDAFLARRRSEPRP